MSQTYHPHIKVNVSQAEKNIIEELARQQNLSTSAFVKKQLEQFLTTEETVNVSHEYLADCKNHIVKVPVSEYELLTIKNNAGAKTVAAYVRDAALNGTKVIRVEVYDDDIVDLMHRTQPQLTRIFNIVNALQVQNKLQDSQYQKLEEILTSISKDIRNTASYVRKNRTSIRQTRLRELRKRCNAAVKTNTDSLAQFDEDE